MTNVALIGAIMMGWASQYSPGRFEEVIANRQAGRTAFDLPQNLPDVDGYVAAQDCRTIGEIVWIRPITDYDRWEKFLIADCGGSHLRSDGLTGAQWMRTYNVLVEVDHATAKRWNTVGRGIQVEMTQIPPLETWDGYTPE